MGALSRKATAAQAKRPFTGLLFCLALICTAQMGPLCAAAADAPQATQEAQATHTAQITPAADGPDLAEAAKTVATSHLYTQAEQAIAMGDYAQAQQLLQQVIQQSPQWAGAWLDLALLAARQDQYAQAEEYLQILDERFAPLPQPIAQAVGHLRSQIAQRHQEQIQNTASGSALRVRQNTFALGAGYETNANAGQLMSSLTLTLPDGDTIVNIDPSSQARSAPTSRATLSHYGQEPLGQGSITWQIQAQTRQYSIAQLNNIELLTQAAIEQAPLPGRYMFGWQAIWLGNQAAYQSPLLRWQYDIPLGHNCGWQQHLQTEARQHLQASHLDSRWQAYRSTWRCQIGNTRSQLYLQAASEKAQNEERPGGNSQHRSWGMQNEWMNPMGQIDHSLLLRVDMLQTQDSQGYSALLDNGRIRQLRKIDTQLTWSAPWAGQAPWRWSASLQKTRQSSNIQFFKQANTSIETSIWRIW